MFGAVYSNLYHDRLFAPCAPYTGPLPFPLSQTARTPYRHACKPRPFHQQAFAHALHSYASHPTHPHRHPCTGDGRLLRP